MTRRAAAYVAAIGVLAGLAGGLAEVIWIWTYAGLTSSDASLVARGVTNAVRFNQNVSPVVSGIAIHMGLASILGVADGARDTASRGSPQWLWTIRGRQRGTGDRVGGEFPCRPPARQPAVC